MHYEDRIILQTPENVPLEVTLAGLGSRVAATLLDWLIRAGLFIALVILANLLPDLSGVPVFIVGAFLIFFGYDILFESLNSGRTPGKRAAGIRVVKEGGGPVGFVSSSIRNLIRLVDMLPISYAAGTFAILASKRNQRLGDMAAGTLVIRDEVVTQPVGRPSTVDSEASSWDVSAITMEELGTVRMFLDRRHSLDQAARARLADQLATRLHPKVGGAPNAIVAESFLERLAAAKKARS